MKRLYMALGALALLPSIALAQQGGIKPYLEYAVTFFDKYLVPLIVSLAVLFFFINIVRYFLIGAANEDGRKKARSLAVWGIIAFFLIVALWGIVRVFTFTFGINSQNVVCPDYINCNPAGSSSGSSSGSPFNTSSGNTSGNTGQKTAEDIARELREAGVNPDGFWQGAP